MKVSVNGQESEISDETSVSLLIKNLALDPRGLAVAVNLSVIPKTNWEKKVLKPDDTIALIRATQGG